MQIYYIVGIKFNVRITLKFITKRITIYIGRFDCIKLDKRIVYCAYKGVVYCTYKTISLRSDQDLSQRINSIQIIQIDRSVNLIEIIIEIN